MKFINKVIIYFCFIVLFDKSLIAEIKEPPGQFKNIAFYKLISERIRTYVLNQKLKDIIDENKKWIKVNIDASPDADITLIYKEGNQTFSTEREDFFKKIPPGIYKVKISLNTYNTDTFEIAILKRDSTYFYNPHLETEAYHRKQP